ncbi:MULTISPECIES: replication initiator protein A [unclassified Aureimonas]|uniref:replication initiator protein A n=1 Tax=unclassified Aureimonas TaxID=2615206 RepID=UPI0006FA7286|nr:MULTISPECIES: replication initiator protein A [unclassified Aureimonas]KQT62065.1 replication protein A [Aureimonas sp. Leaf427]KQT72355.1 replication protein A [Aureimonas sp. Leaf460]
MSRRHLLPASERATLHPFVIATGDASPRDQRDLMERPFFSLAKAKRTTPILYRSGDVQVEVFASAQHGMATIWDADILIWAASQIIEAETAGLKTSRFLRFTPYQLLTAIRRQTGSRDYRLLKGALVRLQSTSVLTTIRNGERWRRHQFSWVNEWEECATRDGRVEGMEAVLPDWFYRGVIDRSLVLSIDPAYFRLTGGIERWLYRVARKHAGRQPAGWQFEVRHLHQKSGSLVRVSDFALQLRRIVERQSIPGYRLRIERDARRELLRIQPLDLSTWAKGMAVDTVGTSHAIRIGTSHATHSGLRTHGSQLSLWNDNAIQTRNRESNRESNILVAPGDVEKLLRDAARRLSLTSPRRGDKR